jgi:hypothetical protein
MALLADGWHMGSHAAALGISVFAYGCGSSETTEPEKINRGLAGSSRGNIDDGASFTVGN